MTAVTSIRADVLKGLLLTAAKEDVRFYLVGIYFDTVNGALVTTDGHRMLAYKCDLPATVKPFILSRTTCEQAIKLASKKNNTLVIHIDGEGSQRRIELRSSAGGMAVGLEVDGRFPEWRRIIPTNCSMRTSQFDGAYLGAMQTAFGLILDGAKCSKPAVMHNGDGPALLLVGGHPELMGIVMPMRQGDENDFQTWRAAFYKSFSVDTTPVADEPLSEAA